MSMVEERFKHTLQVRGIRLTAARKEIFTILHAARRPLPLPQITAKVKIADRTSVYRTLKLFETLQIIHVIPVGWKKHFELAAPFASHHHHIHCETCGKVVSIESPSLENLIKRIAAQKGFWLQSHTLELTGRCANCRNSLA